jgi:HD-like signal output (HDOD) protein
MMPFERNLPHALQVRPEDLVKGTVRLIVVPEIFVRLNRMVDDPRCSGAALAELIGQDPGLAARLLRIANSPFYGFPSQIVTLSRAVTVIGRRGLRDLVLASSACDLFARLGGAQFDRRSFWQHSLFCGLYARLLGLRCGISEVEGLFVAGLLHDIGQLVILEKLPEIGRQTQLRARDGGAPLHLLEEAVIGCDHAAVGGELLRQWRLPVDIWEAVSCHHAPTTAEHAPLGAAIVHVADFLANACFPPRDIDWPLVLSELASCVASPVRDLMQLDERTLREFHEEILIQYDSLAETMLAA